MEQLKELILLMAALGLAILVAIKQEFSAWYTVIPIMVAYAAWHILQVVRLFLWARYPKDHPPPTAMGVWHDVVLRLASWRRSQSKRKRKLQRIANQVEKSYQAIADVTVILNDEDNIQWLNEAAAEFAGTAVDEAMGESFETVFAQHKSLVKYFKRGKYKKMIEISTSKGEERILEIRIFSYGEGKKLLNAQDVSLLRHLERVRQDFVSNVSHELRTPLTVISGYLETMVDSKACQKTSWQPAIQSMHRQAYRMQRTVDDLLVLARFDDSDTQDETGEVIEVARVLEPIMIEARHLSGKKKHDIKVKYDGHTHFYGQYAELNAVMANLVFNAVKYTPPGGKIRVKWKQDKSGATFEVSDSGNGIPEKHLPRLTERFYRVDKDRSRDSGGTGLGLAIVKHAVNRLGGELEITSKEGEGSVFKCSFPNAPDS